MEENIMISTTKKAYVAVIAIGLSIFAGGVVAEQLMPDEPVLAATEMHNGHLTASADNLQWVPGPPGSGVELGFLWGDVMGPGEFGMLVKIEAGAAMPWHAHTHDYYATLIQGSWVHVETDKTEVTLKPGSFVLQEGGKFHGDRC
jgi:quercetin dioxygenase-like cupin family protein